MSKILVLKSSLLGDNSQSNQLINKVIEGKEVIIRDLAANPVPLLDLNVMTAINSPVDTLTEELKPIQLLSDELIAELKSAESVIIGAPMYNFSVPTQLKNYFDIMARAGVTFQYTEQGPKGLIGDREVVVVTTRGGIHKDQTSDTIAPYLTSILEFFGITNVKFVYAEGLNMGDDMANESRSAALEALSV
ncbi:FMN-dependent NADH-azoreductase [Vibrio breoganii]|uniref:FMN-dependent NADH-azoreductase n=1 Tax=Vibrio breoganii TaxID=553239 RepID=UPI000C83FA93|nr:FMN-dependent NADH-azoreductase [Vibrio breoganii]PML13469.1 FMN-dependent NADH-azoreductase [Vibrio breoganii]